MRSLSITLLRYLLVLGLLVPGNPSRAQISGQSPAPSTSSLWLATEAGVLEVDRATGTVLVELQDSASAQAVAIDETRQALWYVSGDRLVQVQLNGTPVFSLSNSVGVGEDPFLEVAAEDGKAWLAAGQEVTATLPSGIQFVSRTFPGIVTDLALAPPPDPLEEPGPVWVATGSELHALSRLTGESLRTLFAPAPIVSIAFDSQTDSLWAVTAETLLRFGSGDEPELEMSFLGLSELVADGLSGVWALQGNSAVRIAIGGEVELAVTPFAAGSLPTTLVGESVNQSAWVSDGQVLLRLTAAGQVQETMDLGTNALHDFVSGPGAIDTDPPLVSLDAPIAGALVEAESVPVSVSWSDAGAGVDINSFALLLDGDDTGADCSFSFVGASCTVTTLPEGAHTLSVEVADFLGNQAPIVSVPVIVDTPIDPGGGGNPAGNPPGLPDNDPEPYRFAHPERGINANRVYLSDEQIETISTSTGNLTLKIPLGQSYSVGGQLSYQFQLVHNSSTWQRISLKCTGPDGGVPCGSGGTTRTMTVPNASSNAGLGWSLHLGRLFSPTPPTGLSGLDLELWPNRGMEAEGGASWLYEAPDGAQHVFYRLLGGRPEEGGRVLYTKDGSHLRLRKEGDRITISEPNGIKTVFKSSDTKKGTLFCGGGVTNCWSFFERRDPYGNRMWVDYDDITDSGIETWRVRDSTGRVHRLRFSHNDAMRGGNDATGVLIRSNGDEWGDLRRILTSVDTAAFGGQRAVFRMDYRNGSSNPNSSERVSRKCPQTVNDWVAGEPLVINTRVLHGVFVPLIPDWKFKTLGILEAGDADGCTVYSGLISEVKLPSRGKLAYTYTNWTFPTRCDYRRGQNPDLIPPIRYRLPGIGTKRRMAASGGLKEGPWIYTNTLEEAGSLTSYGPQCDREKLLISTVKGPVVDGTFEQQVFYTAMTEGSAQPKEMDPLWDWQVTDHKLPYTKKDFILDTEGERVFLSREIFQCPQGQSCNAGHKKRSTYVRYASEWKGSCSKLIGSSPECFRIDPTRIVERTVYHDDHTTPYKETRYEEQNGFGAARRVVEKDDFSGLRTVTRETSYSRGSQNGLTINATTGLFEMDYPLEGFPAPTAPWILHPYTLKTWDEGGGKFLREYKFNDQGTLTCERRRLSSGARNKKDVVVKYDPGQVVGVNAGLPILETWAGGDLGDLSTGQGVGNLCSVVDGVGAADFYTITHEYSDLVLSKSRIGPPTFPKTYFADIDSNTGLPLRTYTVANQATILNYDKLGRLLSARPAASLQSGNTWLFHTSPSNAKPSVKIEQRSNGGVVETVTVNTFDDFGRLFEKKVKRPAIGGGDGWSKQQWHYDKASRLEKETTLQNQTGHSTLKNTRYRNYDAFGRARKVTAPDGQETKFVYFGDRKVDRTSNVVTAVNGSNQAVNTPSTTRSLNNAQGQMVESSVGEIVVMNGEQTFHPVHRTTFKYNPLGALTQARRFADGTNQVRSYGQDGRGFMTSETHPELGAAHLPSGTITYKLGALGQQVERWDQVNRLSSEYDAAGRKTKLRESTRTWAEWTYGTSASAPNFNRGKLIQATRHNYIGDTTTVIDDWKVTETYTYRGALGQVDSKETRLDILFQNGNTTAGPRFTQTWTWDALGRLASEGYPQCVSGSCNGADDSVAPARSVDWSYSNGLPISVESKEAGASVPSQSATYDYHSNLQMHEAFYSNNTSTRYSLGTNNMARPRRIRFYQGATRTFDSGNYEYDASGNIWAIGSDRYTYDLAGRLLSGTVLKGGPGRSEVNTLDGFDNIVQSVVDGNTSAPLLYYTNNKNRMLGGLPDVVDTIHDVAGRLRFWNFNANHTGYDLELLYDALGMQTSFKRWLPAPGGVPDVGEWQNYVDVYGPGNLRLFNWFGKDGSFVYTMRNLSGKVVRTWNVSGPAPGTQWIFDKDYIFGPEGQFASYGNGGTKRFFHADHLGTPRQITDASGTVVGRHNYYPFGAEVPPAAGTYDDRMAKFTGHERDRNGAADYMLGRSYLYPLKRFTTVDPMRDGWNLYAYVGGNPINRVDPDGLYGLSAFFERIEKVSNAVESVVDFVAGAGDAAGSNMVGGLGREEGGSTSFRAGQALGDVVSIVQGALEIAVGTVAASGGSLATVGTGGVAAPVSVPAVAGGAAVVTHGAVTSTSGASKLGEALSRMSRGSSAGHTKGARPSTKGKHQAGDARRGRDGGGEKGDAVRRPPRKPPKGHRGSWPPPNE